MNKTIISIFALALISVGGLAFVLGQSKVPKKLGANIFQSTMFKSASTTSNFTVTGSTRIMATSTSRAYALICNDSANKIYLNLNADKPASTLVGIPVAANSCYTINDQNLYWGSVQASSTVSSSVNVVDYEL